MTEQIITEINHISEEYLDVDIAIGVYVWAEDIIQNLLDEIRNIGFTGRIILGGPQITYSGPGLEAIYPDADIFVRGYGELALLSILQNKKIPIPGVHYAGELDLCQQTSVDLEILPSPWLNGVISLEEQSSSVGKLKEDAPSAVAFVNIRRLVSDSRRQNSMELESSRRLICSVTLM